MNRLAATEKGAIILCGGKSSRMGRDKATLPFGSEVILQRVVRTVSEVVDLRSIVVVANPEQVLPELPPAVRIAFDEHPSRGPLEGLLAGLRASTSDIDAVYATSCDVPLLIPDFIRAMFSLAVDCDIAVPFDGQFHHPLAAVYRPSVIADVQALLESNCLKLSALFDRVSTRRVCLDDLKACDPQLLSLMNLNHPDDYQNALQKAGLEDHASRGQT